MSQNPSVIQIGNPSIVYHVWWIDQEFGIESNHDGQRPTLDSIDWSASIPTGKEEDEQIDYGHWRFLFNIFSLGGLFVIELLVEGSKTETLISVIQTAEGYLLVSAKL